MVKHFNEVTKRIYLNTNVCCFTWPTATLMTIHLYGHREKLQKPLVDNKMELKVLLIQQAKVMKLILEIAERN